MVYLIALSLFLHLVSFFIIVVLYQRIESQKPLDKEKVISEMEDLLVSYTTEMKENNERLARRVSGFTAGRPAQPPEYYDKSGQDARPASHEQVSPDNGGIDGKQSSPSGISAEPESYGNYTPPVPEGNNAEEAYESSDTSKVLSLDKQGFSEQEIARKLNMGTGEVALLLKFYK